MQSWKISRIKKRKMGFVLTYLNSIGKNTAFFFLFFAESNRDLELGENRVRRIRFFSFFGINIMEGSRSG